MLLLTFSTQLLSKELLVGVNQRDIFRFKGNERWVGIDVELIQATAKQAGYKIEIVDMPWTRVLESIRSGQIDITLAATESPERREYALFSSHRFRASHYVLFVRKTKLPLFKGVQSLADITNTNTLVGALRGAIYSKEHYLLQKNSEFRKRIVLIDNDQSLPQLALKGRVDGYIESDIEGKQYLASSPTYQENIIPFVTINLGKESDTQLMFSKKTVSKQLVEKFDSALLNIHRSGTYDKIIQKYSPSN